MANPKVLLVDDDDAFRQVLAGELSQREFDVTAVASGREALRAAEQNDSQIVLLDLQLPDIGGLEVLREIHEKCPGTEVIMLTGHGSIDTAIEAVRIGASDYVSKPCPLDELEVRMQRALERNSLRRRANLLERGLTPTDPSRSFVGDSPSFRHALELIERVAPSDSTVLLCGETGTGKEVAAKIIHARSTRRERPFVVVECAALQDELLQSELFGHEKGAFTGADRTKPGLFEVANGGTIFLDEIGEISAGTQVKLLRVLESSTFRHVGGTSEIRVDVRVLTATNRDLAAMVRQGLFRADLFYRLKTVTIELPPLRERPGDTELLATHFAERLNERYGFRKTISDAAMQQLRRHSWPGNVRELLHAIEAAAVLCEGSEIEPAHLPAGSGARLAGATPASPEDDDRLPTLDQLEREHIERVLRATGGHRGHAAKMLGISERNLYRKIRSHGLG